MIYSVVDIETTGTKPGTNRITEIAIVKTDGTQILEEYSTLIKPGVKIPYFISQMTGITDQMVAQAPQFHEVAKEIYNHLKDTIFVAHNARFDYGFLKSEYESLGFPLNLKPLCTVRLSRATFPGLKSYSLGKLCNELRIPLHDRHRALGDAKATALLLEKIIASKGHPNDFSISSEIKQTILPPQINKSHIKDLPSEAGVYYFLNNQNKIIYVGKSLNIHKRVRSHFQFKSDTSKKPKFFEEIADIGYECMGNELMSLLHEATEIKRHKPRFNRALKRTRYPYAIDVKTDCDGYIHFKIQSEQSVKNPLIWFGSLNAAEKKLETWIERYGLHPQFLNLPHLVFPNKEPSLTHNLKAKEVIQKHTYPKPNALLIGPGRDQSEQSMVLIEQNEFKGKGFSSRDESFENLDQIKSSIEFEPETPDHKRVILSLWKRKEYKKIIL